jgi:hypothetical protein
VGCRGKVMGAPWNEIQPRARRGRAGWREVRSTACSVQRAACIMWMCSVGSNTGVGAVARGTEATGEAVLRRVITPVQAGVVGARWAVLGGQRLSWAAEARAAGGTWVITAH